MKMGWSLLLFALFLSLTSHNAFSHSLHSNKPAVVVGTVFCDTCSQQRLSKSTYFISGAIVAVECRDHKTSETNFKEEVKTNKNGNFKVVLPFSEQEHTNKIETCSVKMIKSSDPFCSVPSSATSSSLKLKNSKIRDGTRVFSAGYFAFKPLKQPTSCNRKNTDILKAKQVNPQLPFPPIIPPIVPPVIQPPSLLPPNPLQPAPLIPNPLEPPTPVIPNPFQPPAPLIPIIPMPPLPILTPPSPPPTVLPPFIPPFLPPIPGIPSGPPKVKKIP
ncbi:hypothetical protein SDJN02_20061 [Cucurbita argyrosperma subsp. argyrosperma]